MAWLSVGTTNDDLCDKLIENGVLEAGSILDAFRNTDRGDFVQQDSRALAYADRPFKQEHVHISAPHMYATVLEQLDLIPGLSFLNVGSGSGYFSCLAACLLGESGLSHGIEVNGDAVRHSELCCQRWYDSILLRREEGSDDLPIISREGISFVEGNCFDIDVAASTACCRYDRIYIGAGCPESKKDFFFSLLADEGIMVAPIDDSNCLVRIKRQCRNVFTVTHISHVHFAPLVRQTPSLWRSSTSNSNSNSNSSASPTSSINSPSTSQNSSPLTTSTSSASVSSRTSQHLVRLPPVLWAPVSSRHKQFPAQFREAVHVLLLASRHCSMTSSTSSSSSGGSSKKYHYKSFPLHIWTFILSFASRDWFVPIKSEAEILSQELFCERRLRSEIEQQLKVALAARVRAERERDIYKLVLHQMSQGGDIANAMQTAGAEEMEEEEEIDEDGEGEEMEEEEEEEEEEEMDEEEEDVDNNAMHYQTAWHSLGVENGDDVGDDDGDWEDIDEDDDQEEEGIIINTDDSDVRPGVSLSVSIPIVD